MNKIKSILVFLFLGITHLAFSQTAPDRYWVQFSDKNDSPYTLSNPSEYLSERAIEKRNRFHIAIQENDLPINPNYISEVLDIGDVSLINKSKWFNAITIKLTDTLLLDDLLDLPFVNHIKSVAQYQLDKPLPSINDKVFSIETWTDYGYSYPQIKLHSGQLLHELGFNGEGINIGVFDAGFSKVDVLPVFENLRNDHRIIDTRDFTDNAESVYAFSTHGRNVLSIMGAYQKDSLIGSAYMANYYLFVTEENSFENIIEEDNWVAAAEYADSIGIDIINTSLGYSTFDDPLQNHSYSDMNGNTTRITIAMNIAASKGIIPVTSAGNSGNNSWHYITAPGDCIDCLTIGAVDTTGAIASFSSFGPSFDGRVKPDVVSVGWHTAYAKSDSTITFGNGTSYSSPLLAGLTACLWQAFPAKTNFEIMQAIRESAHLYSTPNDSLGYGIPDFWKAYQYLSDFSFSDDTVDVKVFPSPFSQDFNLLIEGIKANDKINVSLYNIEGRLIFDESPYLYDNDKYFVKHYDREIQNLSSGIYIIIIEINSEKHTLQLEKI